MGHPPTINETLTRVGQCRLLKPQFLAIGGIGVTGCNLAVGQWIFDLLGPGHVTNLIMPVLVFITVVTPPLSLMLLMLHYKNSSHSLVKVVILYISLVFICANIDFDLVLHFSEGPNWPFSGMPSIWTAGSSGRGHAFSWLNLSLTIVNCIHFSVETLSTVGYGDILPVAWFAKIVVDVQILMSLGITVLTVGTYFSGTRRRCQD